MTEKGKKLLTAFAAKILYADAPKLKSRITNSVNPRSAFQANVKKNSITYSGGRKSRTKRNRDFTPKKAVRSCSPNPFDLGEPPEKSRKIFAKKPTNANSSQSKEPRNLTQNELSERLTGEKLTMVRAFVPAKGIHPGIAKANFKEIATWLRNCETAGYIFDELGMLQRIELAASKIMNGEDWEKNLKLLWTRISIATAFGPEEGLRKIIKITDKVCQMI